MKRIIVEIAILLAVVFTISHIKEQEKMELTTAIVDIYSYNTIIPNDRITYWEDIELNHK